MKNLFFSVNIKYVTVGNLVVFCYILFDVKSYELFVEQVNELNDLAVMFRKDMIVFVFLIFFKTLTTQ
jgi:hypothetical protein